MEVEMEPELAEQLKRVLTAVEHLLPRPVPVVDWQVCQAASWRQHTFSGHLEPVQAGAASCLEDLLGIDRQKQVIEENTRQFLAGLPANNILLWGTRGTGKSSVVRALLSTYAAQGLRLVQVDKGDLVHLPEIVAQIRDEPYRFILFADDVSFETGEASYKVLKSALDGSVYAVTENVLIYVTSNRRHLLPEYESDNRGAMLVNNEIHHGETVEEKISLSGRFGLWVGFHPFTQEQYVEVARQWVTKLWARSGKELAWDRELAREAIDWSHVKGERSGRTAYQFASHWVGKTLLKNR
jgi:uncharacterized protein